LNPVWGAGLFSFWAPFPVPSAAEVGAPLQDAPVIVWSTRLEGAPPDTATRTEPGAPVVAGNHVMVGFSGVSGLVVVDRRSGREVGRYEAGGPVVSPAVVSGDRVYFADAAGTLWCYPLGRPDAEPVWRHYTSAPVVSSPVVSDGVVYVSNVGEQVYALDAGTGELRWRFEHRLDVARTESLELFGAPRPSLHGETLYAGFSDGFLVAIDRKTGTERWNASVGEGTYPDLIAPALAVDETLLVSGFDRPLVSLDPGTRAARWRIDAGTASAMTVDGARVYVGGSDGVLRVVERTTGELLWTWDSLTSGPLAQPVVSEAGVFVAAGEGGVTLLDPGTGGETWRMDPGVTLTGVSSAPAVVGRDVYVLSNAGVLYGLRGPSGLTGRDRPDWVSPR